MELRESEECCKELKFPHLIPKEKVSDLRQSRRHEMLEPLKAVDVRSTRLLLPCW